MNTLSSNTEYPARAQMDFLPVLVVQKATVPKGITRLVLQWEYGLFAVAFHLGQWG